MDTFTLYFVVRAARGWDDDGVTAMAGLLGQDHEDLCMWRDDADPTALRFSIECPADDLEAALSLARELGEETAAASPFPAEIEEVVAMDDEQQLVWRARA